LDDAEESNVVANEILENIRNDMTGINQEIEIVHPVIENDIFFEDLLEKID